MLITNIILTVNNYFDTNTYFNNLFYWGPHKPAPPPPPPIQ